MKLGRRSACLALGAALAGLLATAAQAPSTRATAVIEARAATLAPRVGDTARLKLRDGVITEPFTGTTYCDRRAQGRGVCGA